MNIPAMVRGVVVAVGLAAAVAQGRPGGPGPAPGAPGTGRTPMPDPLRALSALNAQMGGQPAHSKEMAALFGKRLINAKGDRFDLSLLANQKLIGVYFSAHWCPPCRAFTPKLVDVFNTWRQKNRPIEIVFASSDRNEAAMMEYMQTMKMPWVALPFASPYRDDLAKKFGVQGIPTLVILTDQGKVVSTDGRSDVTKLGEKAIDLWAKHAR